MKTLGGIGSIILGVVAILVSVGLQTIWAPPAEFNASTQNAEEAPLTVVTEEIDVDPDEAIEYTVSGEGEFTLMYGQLRDIEAWVGDAAHNRIDGVTTDVERGEDPSLDMTYVDGEAEVPNPADSDLWLATQEVTDEVTQRWAQHDAGEWGLLIAADGTEPAPADFSVSWVNVEPDSPFIMPLMIGGIVLILLGIGLLLWRFAEFRRRAKRTSGRRAAVRGDYTGLTAADVVADTETSTQTMTVQEVEAGEPVQEQLEDEPTTVVPEVDSSEDEHDPDSDDSDGADDSDDGESGSTSQDTTETTSEKHDDDNGFLRRSITAVSAFGLAIGMGVGPAYAASQSPETSEEDLTEQVEDEAVEDETDPDEPDALPLVVDAQFERILDSVVSSLDAGDSEMDAEMLDERVAGQAKRFRDEFYRNNTIDEDYGLGAEVASDDVLATWMDRDEEFPRTIYAVTADAEGGSTQLLALKQQDARSQYQLVHNVPFAPDVELPSGDFSDADVEKIANDDSSDLAMSPDAAVEALTDYLTDPEADTAEDIASNDWIDSIHEHQAELVESHEEQQTDASISRTVFDDSVDSVRLPDGSALVFGAVNSMESLTPSEDTTVTVNALTQELGEFASAEQEDQVRIRYREQFALLIPTEGEVSLVGYEAVQSTVDSGDN